MHSHGVFAPETETDAREALETVAPAAQTVVKEVAKTMGFDRDEYRSRVTTDVVTTARDALFASLLQVFIGTRQEYGNWLADHSRYDSIEVGNAHVDSVVWHPIPFAATVVAATFQSEEDAAVTTLRRQAYGRFYRELTTH